MMRCPLLCSRTGQTKEKRKGKRKKEKENSNPRGRENCQISNRQ